MLERTFFPWFGVLGLIAPIGLGQGADDCANAQVIGGLGPFGFDISSATTDPIPQHLACPFPPFQDVWFRWNAPTTDYYSLSTCGTSSTQTRIAVYQGANCPLGEPIDCVFLHCTANIGTSARFLATQGTDYLLRVGRPFDISGAPGFGSFVFAVFTPEPNDECAGATPIAGMGPFQTQLASASVSPNAPSCWVGDLDVWLAWTAPGTATRDYRFLSNNRHLAVYDGCGGTELACGEDDVDVLGVTGGDTLLIRIGYFYSIASTLQILDVTPAANDECQNATAVTGTGPFPFSTLGASDDDVWFAWTAPTTDFWEMTAVDNTPPFNSLNLDLYDGLACPPTAPLSVNPNRPVVRFHAVAGNDYLLRVGGQQTPGTVFANTLAPPPNDACTNGSPITGEGIFPFDLGDATASGLVSSCADEYDFDIWYRWRAPFIGGPFRFQLYEQPAGAKVSVYSDCGGPLLDCGHIFIVPNLAGSATFRIRISGFTDGGTGQLSINRSIGNPLNDFCANAEPIFGEGAHRFDIFSASNDGILDPACDPTPIIVNDVWYDWTAPRTSTFRVDTCSQTILNTVLAVYEGNACPPTMGLGCSHDDCGLQSLVEFAATEGTHYLFRVGKFVGGILEGGLLRVSDVGLSGGTGLPYCAAQPNSSGAAAQIRAFGSESVATQNLAFEADGLPANVFGLFYFGANQVAIPLGDGTVCAGGQVFRMPIRASDNGGVMTEPSFWALPNSAFVLPGGTWNFQAWFRDSAAGMSGFNLSNGTTLSFAPNERNLSESSAFGRQPPKSAAPRPS